MTLKQCFVVYIKGMAMGAADVIPGVSGGTIAFISGIYQRLIDALSSFGPYLLATWKNDGFKAVWQKIDGLFLICLFAGIITSVLTFAKLITILLHTHPIPLWSFFFGLLLFASYHLLSEARPFRISSSLTLLVGIIMAYAINMMQPAQLTATPLVTILMGAIAICAMILPGISGSFILVMLGFYHIILAAAANRELSTLLLFACGCIIGLLIFSKFLSWLLAHYYQQTLTFLTGLMLGSLAKIWPWKQTLETYTNSHGDKLPLVQKNLMPNAYEQVVGQPSQWLLALICAFIGILLVWGLERMLKKEKSI